MTLLFILAMIMIGIVLLMAEIFLLPGLTIPGLLGVVVIITANVLAYLYFGMETGNIVLVVSVITVVVLAYLAYKIIGQKGLALDTELVSSKENEVARSIGLKVGDTGAAVSDLRPSGDAVINGQKVLVNSTEGFISDNSEVEVTEVTKSTIFVKRKG